MRVAIVTESFLPVVNGVTTSVCRVLDHLAARGHEALVVSPEAGGPADYRGFPVTTVPAVTYRQFPVGLPNPWLQRTLAEFQPDVLHAASPFLLGAQSIAAANRLGVPSVAVFQTDVAGYAKRHSLAWATNLAWKLVRWIHDGADLTLAPSSVSIADLEAAGVPRLARWGRGVDLEAYHPRNRTAEQALALRRQLAPNGELVVGYVGRLAAEKQVQRLAELRGVEGIAIGIVGDGPERERLQRQLAGLPVHFLGRRGGGELSAAYGAFDLFVHTGDEETFGQTLQEAKAAGLPVIAPASGGPLDLVEPGVTGHHFAPTDPSAIRGFVERLRDDAPLRLRMGEAARRSVLDRSWSVIGDELLAHYASVVSARLPQAPASPATGLAR